MSSFHTFWRRTRIHYSPFALTRFVDRISHRCLRGSMSFGDSDPTQDTPSPIFPASRMAVLKLLAPSPNIARHLQILLSVGIASRHIRIRSSCTAGHGSSVLIHRGPENACDAQTQANGPSPKAPRQTARCPLSAGVPRSAPIKSRNRFLADSLGNRRICSAEQAPKFRVFRIRGL